MKAFRKKDAHLPSKQPEMKKEEMAERYGGVLKSQGCGRRKKLSKEETGCGSASSVMTSFSKVGDEFITNNT